MVAGGGDVRQTKAAEKSRKEEIEAEKKRIREVGIMSHLMNVTTTTTDTTTTHYHHYYQHFYLPNPSHQFNFSPCSLCTVS